MTTPNKSPRPVALPSIVHDGQVLRVAQWAVLANISVRSARRIIASGRGPKLVRMNSG
jgi:hypothetical protein